MCPYERDAYFKLGFIAGEGTQESPYLIYTVDELNLLSICPYELDKHFKLMADIDLAGITYSKAVIPKFAGIFDGNNLTISNLTVDGNGKLGLFGQLQTGAEVRDLGIVDVNITGSSYVGGLVGYNNGSAVTRCYSTGTVSSGSRVGGLVGRNYDGIITTSYSTSSVSGTGPDVGGLVGDNSNGNITMSYSTGTVTGEIAVGGLAGMNYEGSSITDSCSTGMVSGILGVGGLVANNQGLINTSFSSGTVTGDEGVGSLVGWNNESVITTSYSTGAVTGNDLVGGLVGYDRGGLATASFWDIETSGLAVSAGGAGLSTAKMMDAEILGLNGLGVDPKWVLDNGRDYPRLVWEGTPGQMIPELVIDWLDGSGTSEDPYQIETANQLLMLHDYSSLWGKHFVMNADIDLDPNLTGQNLFGQAVIPTFWGSFVGNGHVILNLRIEGEERLGLFGKLMQGSVVRDLELESISVKASASGYYVGGLAGDNWGFVTACYSIGTVTGDNYVGGLIGYNVGNVLNCYSTGAVSGEDPVGGLIGKNVGNVLNCYSACSVFGSECVAGLVGDNLSGDVTCCFWDTWISDQNWSGGGIGKTTAEMQTASTFLEAGWDFVDESENGNKDIWWILEGQDYPRLWWELIPEN